MIAVDPEHVARTLHKVGLSGDVWLDFSAVERIDTQAAEAIADLADRADAASVQVHVRGVNAGLHKVLKLMGVGRRFTFTS